MEKEIYNEFDYSNSIIDINAVSYLVKYCDSTFNQLISLMEQDEQKNEKLKSDFKEYTYKKAYNTKFEINIKTKENGYHTLTCKNYDSFIENVNNNHLKNVEALTVNLEMSFKRGKELSLIEYENIFKIVFKPYDIKFSRKSNFDDVNMNNIENNINEILKRFMKQNTIFCTKE